MLLEIIGRFFSFQEGVTGSWFPAWALLHQRTLIYTRSLEPVVLEQIDLRKARCIGELPKKLVIAVYRSFHSSF